MRAPHDGWVRRHDNVALIGCGVSDEIKWRLTCKQNSWQGKLGNCTAGNPHITLPNRKKTCCIDNITAKLNRPSRKIHNVILLLLSVVMLTLCSR